MKTRRRTAWGVFLLLAIAGGAFSSPANESGKWPFLITPQGYPNMEIALVRLDNLSGLPGFTLRHILVFDGESYFSNIVISGLGSSLIQFGRDEFEWDRLGGGGAILKDGKLTGMAGRWKIDQRDNDGARETTIVRDDGAEMDQFLGCYLQKFTRGSDHYSMHYEKGRLTELTQDEPVSKTIVKLEYSDSNVILFVGDRTFNLQYNATNQLVRCVDAKNKMTLVEYSYAEKGLLRKLAVHDRAVEFTWISPEWAEYYSPAIPPPPVIGSDGHFFYRTKINDEGTETHFTDPPGTLKGSWNFNRRSGALRFKLEKGDLNQMEAQGR